MSSLVLTLRETLRYRGAIGQWSWILHRLSGLGVVLFLVLHVIDTSWAVFYPALYEEAIATYQSPLFTIGEFGLVACVIYHAYNGLRIVIIDANPKWWKYQQRAAIYVLGLTALTLIPVFVLMFGHVIDHYNHDPNILPLGDVLVAQLPFVVGIVAAGVAAIFISGAVGLVTGNKTRTKPQKSNIERFWWSFMRVSGVLIVPLVFGHLAMVHVLQGVFDLTAAQSSVVGVSGVINNTGTAVEFVGERWRFLLGGIAVWKVYDIALLALVTVHGLNGLRYVLTDYTMHNPLLRRASVYLCVIGAAVLLTLGTGALLGTIENDFVERAVESQCEIYELEGCDGDAEESSGADTETDEGDAIELDVLGE